MGDVTLQLHNSSKKVGGHEHFTQKQGIMLNVGVGDRSWVMVHFRCINLAKQWVVIGHFTQNQGIMSDGVFTCMTPHANQWVVIKRAHYQKLSSELKACSQMDVDGY